MHYTVKGAALATGVAEDRLRTWERRYGVPNPSRSPTGRRLYSDADLALIRRFAALVDSGVPAAEAAAAVQIEDSAPASAPPTAVDPLVAALVAAAGALDEQSARDVVREAVSRLGWGDAVDSILLPGMRAVGGEWQAGRLTPGHEHFISEVLRSELSRALADLGPAPGAPTVALALPAGERHDLGLLALALLLRQRAVNVVFLGADLPARDLLQAAAESGATGICLAAVTTAGRRVLEVAAREIIASRGVRHLFVGGPALDDPTDSASIAGLRLPQALPAAAQLIADRIGSGPATGPSAPTGSLPHGSSTSG